MEVVEIVKIYDQNVWIENDLLGSKHVMIKHDHPDSEAFTYCSFNYNYAHTSNCTIREQAEKMAISLGAKPPVEYRSRPLPKFVTEGIDH